MKDNKLIAEFMELEVDNGLYCYTTAMDDYKTDTLYFDSSWDWMMPVVKRCLCTDEKTDGQHYFINDSLLSCNIEVVHDRVVEFIKDYNEAIKNQQ